MKGISILTVAAVICLCGSFSTKISGQPVPVQTGDSARSTVTDRQENDFLKESEKDAYAYEFTQGGDYRFVVTEVVTPPFDFLNFCLDGPVAGLHFEDRRIICPEVKNEFRCITDLSSNLASNEYVVKGVRAGTLIKVWPSNPSIVLKPGGVHCTNNKFNCTLYGPQAEWDSDGYKIKVMVMKYH